MAVRASLGRWWVPAVALGAAVAGLVVLGDLARPVPAVPGAGAPGDLAPEASPVLVGSGGPARAATAEAGPPTAELVQRVASAAPEACEEQITRLLERVGRGALAPEELLALALLPRGAPRLDGLAERAEERLRRLGFEAVGLLGRLFDLLEGDDENARRVAARLVGAAAGAGSESHLEYSLAEPEKTPPGAAEAVAPFLARITALLGDDAAELDARLAVLALLDVLGPRAEATAPLLVAWIQKVQRDRDEMQRAMPDLCVSWNHYEFRIQRTLSGLGAPAIPAILAALAGEDDAGSWVLRNTIEEMGPAAAEALRGLAAHPDGRIRAAALKGLSRILGTDPEALRRARDGLRDPSANVRVAAVEGLAAHGAAAAEDLLAAFRDPDDGVRSAALAGLERLPEAAATLRTQLLETMRTGTYGERLGVLGVLAQLGAAGAEATPYVLDLLGERGSTGGSSDFIERMHVEVLQAFGPAALPWLVQAASGAAGPRRDAALRALSTWPNLEPRDVGGLVPAVGEAEGASRMALAAVLARVGRREAVAVLLDGLAAADEPTRVAAAAGLQHAGPLGVEALPRLTEGLRVHEQRLHAPDAAWHEEWTPYYAYYRALEQIGRHAPDRMVALLSDANDEVRGVAVAALALAGEDGARAIERAWTSLDAAARAHAVGALGAPPTAGPRSETARRRLRAALEDPSPGVRLTAARAQGGEETLPDVATALIGLLGVADGTIAQEAAWELRKLGATLAPFEAALRAALPPPGTTARAWVQDALDAIHAR